jgi:hypothetical protein
MADTVERRAEELSDYIPDDTDQRLPVMPAARVPASRGRSAIPDANPWLPAQPEFSRDDHALDL